MLLLQTINNELHAALEYRVRGSGPMHAVIDDVIGVDAAMQTVPPAVKGMPHMLEHGTRTTSSLQT
jgi:hypothetical protein